MGYQENHSTLSRIETAGKIPGVALLKRICAALGVPVASVFMLVDPLDLEGDPFVREITGEARALTPANRAIVIDVLRDLDSRNRRERTPSRYMSKRGIR